MDTKANRRMDFRLLGPLTVHDGVERRAVGAPMQRAVLAKLLLNVNRVVPSADLVQALWPSDAPSTAKATLHSYVMRLRRALGPAAGARIRTRLPGYLIEVGADEVDVARFRDLAGIGRAAADAGRWEESRRELTAALAQWRGEPFMDLPELTGYLESAVELAELRLQVLEWRVDADLQLGRHSEVVGEISAIVSQHPLREHFTTQLLIALYRCNRQSDALSAYRQARQTLIDEIGVEPSQELQRLHQQILDREVPPPAEPAIEASAMAPPPHPVSDRTPVRRPSVPAQLPADTLHFTGYGHEIGLLTRLRPSGDGTAVVVASVNGPGGVGKTTLAVRVGHQLRAEFPDGQLFASLGGMSDCPAVPAEILDRFLRDLGVPAWEMPSEVDGRTVLFRTLAATRRMLIILDDARDYGQIEPLIPGGGGSLVLVTSRNQLTDLVSAHHVSLVGLNREDSTKLLAQAVGANRLAAEPVGVQDLVSHCAGLPLALRIVGARLAARPHWRIDTLRRRIADNRRRLTELTVDSLSVRSCLAASLGDLRRKPEREGMSLHRAFCLLSLWDGAQIGTEAAAAILGVSVDCAEGLLDALRGMSLIEEPEELRYRFHDLVRVFAMEIAETQIAEAERKGALERAAVWYATSVASADRIVAPARRRAPTAALHVGGRQFGGQAEALAWFEAEEANAVSAIRAAVAAGEQVTAWRIAAAATWSLGQPDMQTAGAVDEAPRGFGADTLRR